MAKDDLSSDYKWAIGCLVVETAKLESAMTDLIASATEMGILSSLIFVHHQQHSSKIDSLSAFYNFFLKDTPSGSSIIERLNQARVVADFRNAVSTPIGQWKTAKPMHSGIKREANSRSRSVP